MKKKILISLLSITNFSLFSSEQTLMQDSLKHLGGGGAAQTQRPDFSNKYDQIDSLEKLQYFQFEKIKKTVVAFLEGQILSFWEKNIELSEDNGSFPSILEKSGLRPLVEEIFSESTAPYSKDSSKSWIEYYDETIRDNMLLLEKIHTVHNPRDLFDLLISDFLEESDTSVHIVVNYIYEMNHGLSYLISCDCETNSLLRTFLKTLPGFDFDENEKLSTLKTSLKEEKLKKLAKMVFQKEDFEQLKEEREYKRIFIYDVLEKIVPYVSYEDASQLLLCDQKEQIKQRLGFKTMQQMQKFLDLQYSIFKHLLDDNDKYFENISETSDLTHAGYMKIIIKEIVKNENPIPPSLVKEIEKFNEEKYGENKYEQYIKITPAFLLSCSLNDTESFYNSWKIHQCHEIKKLINEYDQCKTKLKYDKKKSQNASIKNQQQKISKKIAEQVQNLYAHSPLLDLAGMKLVQDQTTFEKAKELLFQQDKTKEQFIIGATPSTQTIGIVDDIINPMEKLCIDESIKKEEEKEPELFQEKTLSFSQKDTHTDQKYCAASMDDIKDQKNIGAGHSKQDKKRNLETIAKEIQKIQHFTLQKKYITIIKEAHTKNPYFLDQITQNPQKTLEILSTIVKTKTGMIIPSTEKKLIMNFLESIKDKSTYKINFEEAIKVFMCFGAKIPKNANAGSHCHITLPYGYGFILVKPHGDRAPKHYGPRTMSNIIDRLCDCLIWFLECNK